MTREQAEVMKVARSLFAPGVLVGVVTTGDGGSEKGFAFLVCEPTTGVAIGIRGAGVQVFKLHQNTIQRMRESGDLLSTFELGSARVIH